MVQWVEEYDGAFLAIERGGREAGREDGVGDDEVDE